MKTDQRKVDMAEFNGQIAELEKKLAELTIEHQTVSVTNIRFDQILCEKNAIRIKLNALKVRRDNMGRLTAYAVPDKITSIPNNK
ncbi:MAG: hypothetical protein MH137_11280 [Flavobacteriales bacterium]|nr:hypothetical protein [Flavobacteriales bacterium]